LTGPHHRERSTLLGEGKAVVMCKSRWHLGFVIGILLSVGASSLHVSAGNSQYFPETKQTSSNAFYDFWLTHGQTEILGLPLSPIYRTSEPSVMQVYERAVMEWHPENVRENRVLLRLLGSRQLDLFKDEATARSCALARRKESIPMIASKVKTPSVMRHPHPMPVWPGWSSERSDTRRHRWRGSHSLLGDFLVAHWGSSSLRTG